MIRLLYKHSIRFIILVLLQVYVFNHIQFSGYINPYIYILFILLLPFETPGWVVLPVSFLLGLTIDLFANTPGMHAASATFMGFLRPSVLKLIAPREGYESTSFPTLEFNGLYWFIRYAVFLTVAHHLFLFYIEMFRLSDFFPTLLRVILSSIFTSSLIVSSQYFFFRR